MLALGIEQYRVRMRTITPRQRWKEGIEKRLSSELGVGGQFMLILQTVVKGSIGLLVSQVLRLCMG